MKAKEYAILWNSWQVDRPTLGVVFNDAPEIERDKLADDDDLIGFLCQKILDEYKPLVKLRRAKTPEALEAILRELIQKYEAVCRRVEGLPSGFLRKFLDLIMESHS